MKKILFVLLFSTLFLFLGSASAEEYLPRQEFIQMINSCLNISTESKGSLKDVPANHPYFKDIRASVDYGYVKGDENGNLNPYDPLTRAEAVTMLGRIMGTSACSNTGFNDDSAISDWAKPSVKSLTDLKIITGHDDFTFRPNDFLTKSQGEIIISRIKNNLYAGGNGSESSPYVISSFFHLRNISLNHDKHFILKNDLDLTDCNYIFYPIKNFSGSFDASGCKIIGIDSSDNAKALFKSVEEGGKVLNIKLSNIKNYFAIADINNGTILNCANISCTGKNSANIEAEYIGNICNINSGTVKNCYNASVISCSEGSAAGICGINYGTVLNCFNTGTSDEKNAVGICTLNYASLKNCFNAGVLSGNNSRAITSKTSQSAPQNCYYTSKMFSPGEHKLTDAELISIFSNLEDFESLEEYKFPTLKSNPYYANENYTDFGGGDGSSINPYIISNKEHFLNIKKHLNSHFKQVGDISLSGVTSLTPIGTFDLPFTGAYDGGGFNISNIMVYSSNKGNFSLFGYNTGTIKNVHIKDSYIYADTCASLVLENDGQVINCSSDAYINCTKGSGLIFINSESGVVENCVFYGSVTGKQTSAAFAYTNSGILKNCLCLGSVKAANAGGMTYINNGRISTSCSFSSVSGIKSGLLAFENNGDISKCYFLDGTSATITSLRGIEAFPRTRHQAEYKEAFEFLDFNVWRITKAFPELISIPSIKVLDENITDFAGGTGSPDNPFRIVTPQHFLNIAKYPSRCFVLANDIYLDLISRSGEFKTIEVFSGYLNGGGHTISGLNQQGISSLIQTNYGIITGLTINNFKLFGDVVAPFAITNNGAITLCKNNSPLSGSSLAGIAAVNNSIIERCINNASLTGSMVSGISLSNTGEISDCLNSGHICGINENSKITGISSGGNISSSIVTADLYFESGIGKFYPIADTSYTNCYYLDRYNQKFNGNVTFVELLTKDTLKGIDFNDIWATTSARIPCLNNLPSHDLNIPKTFTSGDGSQANPFVILTLNDLYNIRMYPNACFKLVNDIVMGNLTTDGILNNGGKGFSPIENFTGILDGNNSIIYGIEIIYSDLENAGIFAENHGTVKNLGFSGVRVEGKNATGAVCGINYGTLSNIKVLGSCIGSAQGDAGSVCGINYGDISSCLNYSDIFGASSAGGIVGVNHKNVLTSTNWGGVIAVSDDSSSYSGGIAGQNLMSIEKCVNNGKVFSYSDKRTAYAGGITGLLNGNVKYCYNTGEHTAKSPSISLAGGIAGGGENMSISNVYNIGYGLTSSASSYVGSIVGGGSGNISNSYYDHTLTLPCSGESISETSVFAISSDDFANLENLPMFSKDIWTLPKGSTYYYPQLKDNLHINKTYSNNVRDFGGGDGSITNPYRILTAEHLNNIRKYLGSSFVLMGNIDMRKYLREHNFSPIGDNIFGFFGTFMGNGYEIIGLETTDQNYGGLFRQNHGEIYDLTISGGNITGNTAGAVCALNTGLIYRCSSSAQINNGAALHVATGGIVGINKSSGMIVSCSNKSSISAKGQSTITGGLASSNYGIIAGSINYGEVSSSGSLLAISGGIAGVNTGTVSDCANILSVSSITDSSGSTIAGGISGTNSGTLVNCYSASDFIKGKTYGGITANNSSAVFNCYYNNSVNIPCSLGECDAFKVTKHELTQRETFDGFDFDEMWYASGSHLPVPFETLY